jgi:hypothetical protein
MPVCTRGGGVCVVCVELVFFCDLMLSLVLRPQFTLSLSLKDGAKYTFCIKCQ